MNGLGFLAGRLDGVVVKLDIGDRVWTTGLGGSRRRMSNLMTWLNIQGESDFSLQYRFRNQLDNFIQIKILE